MENLSLDDFALFTQIAQMQSLSGAARERNISPSLVSRSLARIETKCNSRLVHRTTHGLSLTHEGEVFLEFAKRILSEQRELQEQLGYSKKTISGTVVISISQLLAEYVLVPHLTRLRNLYPQLNIDLRIEDRIVSMAREGIDIAVRAGLAPAESLIARQLGSHRRSIYASPDYLKTYGEPTTPKDLERHTLIGNTTTMSHNVWHFDMAGKTITQSFEGHIRVNSSSSVVSLALQGAGIARINDVVGENLAHQGRLIKVLSKYQHLEQHPIYAVILAERHRAIKIRACMAFLETCFVQFKQYPQSPPPQS